MAMTAAEFRELVNALYEHPEWRAELRRLVLTDEILSLPEIVRQLAEAQRRTEQQVEELARRMDMLTQRVDNLGRAFGAFQRVFGSTVEEEAASVVEVVLRRKGYRVLQPAYALPIDSEGEIDVVLPLEDSSGRRLWAVVEAKARLSRRDVQAWAQRMRSAEWRRQLAERGCAGPYLAYLYSIRMDLGAQEAAEAEGIGLLKSDGEVLAPRGLIEPAMPSSLH